MDTLQEEIIQQMGVQAEIDPQEEIQKTIQFMKEYLTKHSFLKTLVLGISGGQDSTLLGKLAQEAMLDLRQETGDSSYQFIAVSLPYGIQADYSDVEDTLDWIQPDRHFQVNIKSGVDASVQELEKVGLSVSDFNKGNMKARHRMLVQYAIAGEYQGAVLGTDHAAERVVGFYTKYGDGAADLMPLHRLNKRQGRAMLEELEAPSHLIEKVPTADLEDDQPMLSDEKALGVSYNDIDDYLEGRPVSDQARQRIEKLYLQSEHKRRLPITVFDGFWR